ncbi:hypothetical protein HAHE_30120 [Haloferula helveola]|uniref:HEAT repeat domain-containing protein n=1 Tax=Haloferula helveola TaxID=490095 RepID=A0ABN6H914_9BACT|nr:hypothetical protein HAHE_30120 [Haloferula helveola]
MLSTVMEDADQESRMVSIRCPGCGQRFKVGPELKGKMVECGTCDRRFRVEEDIMIRDRKFYPGERRDPSLQRFSRVPLRSGPEPAFETANTSPEPDPRSFVEPVSPLRVILGFAGVTGAAVVALILIFGGGPGGLLDGTAMDKRLVFAGFTALVAWVLLFFANPTQRIKAVVGGLLISAALLSLPFLFTKGLPIESAGDGGLGGPIDPGPPTEPTVDPETPYDELKQEMGYGKLAEAIESYGSDGLSQGRTAIGIWLRDVRLYNKQQIVEYLMRATDAGERSWIYSRPPSDYLMVLYDVRPELGPVRKSCERFGKVGRVLNDLQVIEVVVDNDRFVQGPLDKLQDSSDPSFYELNRRELESIDLHRAGAAVRRLVPVEPRLYRDDIVRRMQELLEEGGIELKRDVARALSVWAQSGDGSVAAVRKAASELMEEGEDVPRSVVEFLVGNRDLDSIPLIHGLWREDSKEWEALYGDMGPRIETSLLSSLPELTPTLKLSAVRLLGRVGTSSSLPKLSEEKEGAVSELAVTIEQAINAIESRQE